MGRLIQLVLSDFTLTFLIVGLIASAIALARAPKPLTAPVVVEALFAYFILFSIGFSFFYNFVMHVFFGEMAARFIGWADSPFQAEVGFASLGFAVVGLLAFKGSFGLRLAAIVGPACFLWAPPAGTSTRWSPRIILRPAMRGSFSTAISWCRSWASFFCGCSGGGPIRPRSHEKWLNQRNHSGDNHQSQHPFDHDDVFRQLCDLRRGHPLQSCDVGLGGDLIFRQRFCRGAGLVL